MTQLERVLAFLKAHPGEQFIAKEIAAAITQQFADDYTSKRNNPRFTDERSFTAQVAAEIGAHKKALQLFEYASSLPDELTSFETDPLANVVVLSKMQSLLGSLSSFVNSIDSTLKDIGIEEIPVNL